MLSAIHDNLGTGFSLICFIPSWLILSWSCRTIPVKLTHLITVCIDRAEVRFVLILIRNRCPGCRLDLKAELKILLIKISSSWRIVGLRSDITTSEPELRLILNLFYRNMALSFNNSIDFRVQALLTSTFILPSSYSIVLVTFAQISAIDLLILLCSLIYTIRPVMWAVV